MSKSKKNNVTTKEVVDEVDVNQNVNETKEVKEQKVQNVKNTKVNKNKKKAKKDNPNSVGKKFKGTVSELKKVTWPKFSEVVKQTGVVLAFVAITVVLLLGINSLLGWIFGLLVG